jgi:hypothetical protein
MSAAVSQADFAACLLEPMRAPPPGLVAWNGSDPAARLAVYRNNVVSSLIDALADTCPVVQAMVGVEFFRAMASVFVRQQPPHSRLLVRYGEDFPEFIAGFAPARVVPGLADLARLEVARVRAYHAADAEPVSAVVVAQALASGDRVGELRLQLHPSLSLVESAHAVVSIWAAHQEDDGALEDIDVERAEAALVLRFGLDVMVLPLGPGGATFVSALQQGQALGEAASHASALVDDFDLSLTLALLLGHGALSSIHLPARYPE